MNTLTKVLIGLLAILAIAVIGFLVYSSDAPKRLNVERSMVMDNSPDVVYGQIINLKNWENWSPWKESDPSMQITYGEQTSGEGASYSWTSEKQGNGELIVKEVRPNEYVKNELLFEGEDGANYGIWNLQKQEDGKTKVSWKLESGSDMGLFGRGMAKIFNVEEMVSNSFDNGLAKMKEIVENMPKTEASDVKEMELMGTTFMAVKGVTKTESASIEEFMSNAYGAIMQEMGMQGKSPAGFPCSFTYKWDPENNICEMAAAMPLTPITEPEGDPKTTIETEMGDMRVYETHVEMDYFGPYAESEAAHMAINEWIGNNKKSIDLPVIEQYRNDPTEVKPEEIHTRIIYRLL